MIVQGVHPSGWAPFSVSRIETHSVIGVAPRSPIDFATTTPAAPSTAAAPAATSAREGFSSNQHQMAGVFGEIRIFPSFAAERPTPSLRSARRKRSGSRNRSPWRTRSATVASGTYLRCPSPSIRNTVATVSSQRSKMSA